MTTTTTTTRGGAMTEQPGGAWGLRFTLDGRRHTAAGMSRQQAEAQAADLAASVPDTQAVAVDLHAELADQFPAGARVHWNHGDTRHPATGVIVPETGVPLSAWPPEVPVASVVDHGGEGLVCVLLDGHEFPVWVRASYVHVCETPGKETP